MVPVPGTDSANLTGPSPPPLAGAVSCGTADSPMRWRQSTSTTARKPNLPPATLLKSVVGPVGLSGRRAHLPWGLCCLNSGSLLSTRERLL
jgi:hypothetical protein